MLVGASTEFITHVYISGTFNNETGLSAESSCQSCLPGHYCPLPGATHITGLCLQGYYCAGIGHIAKSLGNGYTIFKNDPFEHLNYSINIVKICVQFYINVRHWFLLLLAVCFRWI